LDHFCIEVGKENELSFEFKRRRKNVPFIVFQIKIHKDALFFKTFINDIREKFQVLNIIGMFQKSKNVKYDPERELILIKSKSFNIIEEVLNKEFLLCVWIDTDDDRTEFGSFVLVFLFV
jgi:hypothetical protein